MTSLLIGLFVGVAATLVLLPLPFAIWPSRWEVRAAQLHTMGLYQLLGDDWEPFSGSGDVVFLRRRTMSKPRPMPPGDAARFKETQGT